MDAEFISSISGQPLLTLRPGEEFYDQDPNGNYVVFSVPSDSPDGFTVLRTEHIQKMHLIPGQYFCNRDKIVKAIRSDAPRMSML